MITIEQRAKVIGVCTAVNLFFELVGTLYSCVGHYVVGVVAMDDASMFQYYLTLFPTFLVLREQTSVACVQ